MLPLAGRDFVNRDADAGTCILSQAAAACDVFLAVGSTLTVEPAASLCGVAVAAGAALVIVNRDPTPYDPLAAEVVSDPIGEAIPRIARQLRGGAAPG